MKRGLFITVEGGDGAGKTTLIEQISSGLAAKGRSVLKVREPGGTQLGENLRNIILHQRREAPLSPYAELCLFLASRAQHILEVIGPALEAGKIVLCDRFNDSSIAYQGAARGLGREKVAEFCAFISQELEPHLTLYLDLDPALGIARAKKDKSADRIEAEGVLFQERIREAFLAIHRENPRRFHLLDASLPPARVYEQAMKLVQPLLDAHHVR